MRNVQKKNNTVKLRTENDHNYYRGAMLDKCCKCIQALSTRALTARELSEEIKFSLKTSYRYLEAISLTFPLSSEEMIGESGHKVERFKITTLIDKEKFKQDIVKEVQRIVNERF